MEYAKSLSESGKLVGNDGDHRFRGLLKNILSVPSAKLMVKVIPTGMLALLALLLIPLEYFLEKKCQVGTVINL